MTCLPIDLRITMFTSSAPREEIKAILNEIEGQLDRIARILKETEQNVPDTTDENIKLQNTKKIKALKLTNSRWRLQCETLIDLISNTKRFTPEMAKQKLKETQSMKLQVDSLKQNAVSTSRTILGVSPGLDDNIVTTRDSGSQQGWSSALGRIFTKARAIMNKYERYNTIQMGMNFDRESVVMNEQPDEGLTQPTLPASSTGGVLGTRDIQAQFETPTGEVISLPVASSDIQAPSRIEPSHGVTLHGQSTTGSRVEVVMERAGRPLSLADTASLVSQDYEDAASHFSLAL